MEKILSMKKQIRENKEKIKEMENQMKELRGSINKKLRKEPELKNELLNKSKNEFRKQIKHCKYCNRDYTMGTYYLHKKMTKHLKNKELYKSNKQ